MLWGVFNYFVILLITLKILNLFNGGHSSGAEASLKSLDGGTLNNEASLESIDGGTLN